MSRITILLVSIITTLSAFAQVEELTETRLLNPFNELTATSGVNIRLIKSSKNRAEVRISNALLSDVITEVNDEKLTIKMRPQINKEISVLVTVYYKDLDEISVTKGASLETKTVILTDIFKVYAGTGGCIKAEVECKDLKVTAAGGANISLHGWAERYEAKATTKAEILTKTLKADNAFVKAATGAEIWVNPKLYMEAIANGGGTIYYTSMPEKKAEKTSSGGEIRNKVAKPGGELIENAEM